MSTLNKVFTNENIESIVNHYYIEYTLNIQSKRFSINSDVIDWKRIPDVDGKDATFFHLITVGYKKRDEYCCPDDEISCEKNFTYNPMMDPSISGDQRSICGFRILNLDKIILTFQKKDNLIWEKSSSGRGGRKQMISILNQEHKYHVVLRRNRNGTILFWTAYPVSSSTLSLLKQDYKRHKSGKKYILSIQ